MQSKIKNAFLIFDFLGEVKNAVKNQKRVFDF